MLVDVPDLVEERDDDRDGDEAGEDQDGDEEIVPDE